MRSKKECGNASLIKDNWVVSDIMGNKYRLVVRIVFEFGFYIYKKLNRIMHLVRKTHSILCTLCLLFCLETKKYKKIKGFIKIAKIYPISLRRKSYAAAYTHD
jgi:hypothetical protein